MKIGESVSRFEMSTKVPPIIVVPLIRPTKLASLSAKPGAEHTTRIPIFDRDWVCHSALILHNGDFNVARSRTVVD